MSVGGTDQPLSYIITNGQQTCIDISVCSGIRTKSTSVRKINKRKVLNDLSISTSITVRKTKRRNNGRRGHFFKHCCRAVRYKKNLSMKLT